MKHWRTSCAALALLCVAGRPQEANREALVIRVSAEGWGDAGPGDITKVLQSAGESLAGLFLERKFPVLEVSRSSSSPITLFQRGPAGEIRVKLDVEGRHWAQFAFQFGHEMGHIVCGYAEYPNPNLWFEETLCETASLFVLGRMAESWKTRPPYPNWKDYATALKKYREERIAKEQLPEGSSLADWFRGQQSALRKDGTQRSLNLKMAVAILPLFEETPERWEAVAALNSVRGDASRSFAQYLRDWSRSSPEKHREFIAKIAGRFGVSIDR
jgi:hypothetical protein